MGLTLTAGSRAVAWITVVAVLVVGVTDWIQGSTPEGLLDLGDSTGLALFVLTAVGVGVGAVVLAGEGDDEPVVIRWVVVITLATVAALIADPTYAVLLLAVPLVHIARRWPDPLRHQVVAGLFVLAVVLVSLEPRAWQGGDLEATLVLFIALGLTTLLGYVLGRLDMALRSESELARRDEREQLAAELHDSVGHSLLASSIQLRTAQALWGADDDGARQSVELASRAVDDALLDTRVAVDTIRSRSEPFSLADALPELIERIASPSLRVDLKVNGAVDDVDQLTQITLYRVAQEALTNVVRHADASSVTVEHEVQAGAASLVVADDGVGFDVEGDAVRLGLRSLDERVSRIGGRLTVGSQPGEGTRLDARVERAS